MYADAQSVPGARSATALRAAGALAIFVLLLGSGSARVAHAGIDVWSSNGPEDGDTTAAIDPAMPTTLYAGTGTGLFKSADGGTTWKASGGTIWRIVDRGGEFTIQTGTFAVNSTADAPDALPGDGVCATAEGACTLRAAIDEANALPGGSVITIPAGVYGGGLQINVSLTLRGAGAATTRIEGGGTQQVLRVASGSVKISDVTIANGVGDCAGIVNDGDLSLTTVSVTANVAHVLGGGICNAGKLTLTDSTVSDNSILNNCCPAFGAGLYNSGDATLTNVVIRHNTADGPYSGGGTGGGIYNSSGATLSLTDSTISDNTCAGTGSSGGGLYNEGSARIAQVTISSNVVGDHGAGIANFGSLDVTNSTVSDNALVNTLSDMRGGGLFNFGSASLTNVTISANLAGDGGGIYTAGCATLTNVTISGNTSAGIHAVGGGCAPQAKNTIVANNPGDNCVGGIASLGHNLSSDGTCGFDFNDTDVKLGPLRDNGGSTFTQALLPGSPAIDAGDDAVTGPPLSLTTDQRGRPRKAGLHVDMGAYESEKATITVNDTGDSTIAEDSKCTLREAIANVNAAGDTTGGDCSAGTGGGDTIVFNLTLPATIMLTTNTELVIAAGVTISGPTAGALAVDGNSRSAVLDIVAGTVRITNLTIQHGNGGGIENRFGGSLTLTNCTLNENTGGGLENDGTATLTNCTLSDNSGAYFGGLENSGTATLTNCTLSGNSAVDGYIPGGGIFNDDGTLTLIDCTLSGNTNGGLCNGGTAALTNTIVANNSGENCASSGGACGGGIQSGGHNLSSDGTCFSSPDLLDTDPRLAPLANYGGRTQTVALQAGSPAINAGDPKVCASPPVNGRDQRGYRRPGTGSVVCSIGAYEYSSPGPCVGDCDGSGEVTSEDRITLLSVTLGTADLGECSDGDWTGDGEITVEEIVLAVNATPDACPAFSLEQRCLASGGAATTSMCCLSVGDFPDACTTGACGCGPQNSHDVRVCDCGETRCWDGSACSPGGPSAHLPPAPARRSTRA